MRAQYPLIYDPDSPDIEFIDSHSSIPPKIGDVQSELLGADQVFIAEKPRKWNPAVVIICWSVICLASSAIAILAFAISQNPKGQPSDKANLLSVNLAVKMEVGQREVLNAAKQPNDNPFDTEATSSESINSGTVEERYCYVALIGETKGPGDALEALESIRSDALEQQYQFDENEKRLESILISLYEDYSSGTFDNINQSDRDFLIEQLGYAGKLAIFPKQTSHSDSRREVVSKATMIFRALLGVFIVGLLCAIGSFIAWTVFIVMVMWKKTKPTTDGNSGNGQIYLESFTIWLIVFFGFPVLAMLAGLPDLLVNLSVLVSLVALGWPIARGIPFKTMCKDVGLQFKNPIREILIAFGCYLMVLPGLLLGIIALTIVTNIFQLNETSDSFAVPNTPGHPIIEDFANGSWEPIVIAIVAAAVLAPIIEEVAFRGLLYRHLRDWSAKYRTSVSILFACLVNSFIFTIIHPQSWVGLFVLMPLALGFSLVREWRNSLLAPITMHAINNGAISIVMLLMAI